MLIEIFACAKAKEKTSFHHGGNSSGGLGQDGGMDAHDRAGHAGADVNMLGGESCSAQDSPDKRALSLGADPGVKMIGDDGKGKTYIFGLDNLLNQFLGRMFLTG